MRISDWSSDVCSSDLRRQGLRRALGPRPRRGLRVAARRPLPSRRTRRRSVVNIAQAHGPFRVESVAFAETGDELLAVRETVFVVEQTVPVEEEHDAQDPRSLHAIAPDRAGHAIGTGRRDPKSTRLNSSPYCATGMPAAHLKK